MGCGTGIVKFGMFFFNFIFVVGGIGMVAIGALAFTKYSEYENIVNLGTEYKAPPIILIVVGSAVFLVAFMGCCGVLRESNCMMMTFAVFLLIILLVQVGIAVAAGLHEDKFKDALNKGLKETIKKYDDSKTVRDGWDAWQQKFKCCGSNNYTDWKVRDNVPISCCKEKDEGCADGVLNDDQKAKDKLYNTGCVDKVLSDISGHSKWVLIAAAVIGGIEIFGVLFACCLAARFRRKNYV